MHCEKVRSLLHDYIEGTLNRGIADQVEAHLNRCADCRREWQFVNGIWRGLETLPEVTPPADLHARIMTHVRANTRAREAQQRRFLWRWLVPSLSAAAVLVIAIGLFTTQTRGGVQGGLGNLPTTNSNTTETLPQPVPAGVRVEWREVAQGEQLPVLEATLNREATASLVFTPNAQTPPREGTIVWQGQLLPQRTIEIPLKMVFELSTERVATLWWNVDDQYRALFIPAGYPPARIATVRLNAPLSEALAKLAGLYQTPIEWVPSDRAQNPIVVLNVEDATLEEALNQLLNGTGYQLKQTESGWRVAPQ